MRKVAAAIALLLNSSQRNEPLTNRHRSQAWSFSSLGSIIKEKGSAGSLTSPEPKSVVNMNPEVLYCFVPANTLSSMLCPHLPDYLERDGTIYQFYKSLLKCKFK